MQVKQPKSGLEKASINILR